ncbi:MAG: hypothetical protein ACT4N2_00290 [Hyphomicrobium sp.]
MPAAVAPQQSEAARVWEQVQNSESIPVLEGYRKQFGAANPYYDSLAASRIETLQQARASADALIKNLVELDRERMAMLEKQGAASPAEVERAKAAAPMVGETFRDCEECPEMVVVPAGESTMGSPESEEGRSADEGPQRTVKIAKPSQSASTR